MVLKQKPKERGDNLGSCGHPHYKNFRDSQIMACRKKKQAKGGEDQATTLRTKNQAGLVGSVRLIWYRIRKKNTSSDQPRAKGLKDSWWTKWGGAVS